MNITFINNNDSNLDVMNYCILTGKYYIFGVKNNGETVSFFNYLLVFKNKMEVMKMRYGLKDEEHVFEEKWSTLFHNL